LGKYEWVNNDSSFWQYNVKNFAVKDSIISQADVKNNGLYGKDVLVKKSGSYDTYKRMRLLVDGNIIYKLFISGSRAEVMNDNADKFFSGFTILTPLKENFLNKSKTPVLLSDLLSSDSTTRNDAYSALYNAHFTEKDLPQLHDALLKKYPPLYDSAQETIINDRIARSIESVGSNTSVDFVKDKYASFTGNDEQLKSITLSVLAGIRTKYSYESMINLMKKSMPRVPFTYTFETNIKDSLALTAGIFPSLLSFAKDSLFTTAIANIAVTMIDSGLASVEVIKPYENDFISYASIALKKVMKDKDDYDYNIYKLVQLLGQYNNTEAYIVLKGYLQVKNLWLLNAVTKQLLKGGQTVPAATLITLAADMGLRSAFYNDLKELDKTSLFPAEYLTQQHFAQADVYASADDDEGGSVRSVTFLMKKNAVYRDTTYTFYLYKVVIGEGEEAVVHLGIAGGYKPGSTTLEPSKYLTSLYWKEDFDEKKMNDQFKAFIAGLDAEESEGGE